MVKTRLFQAFLFVCTVRGDALWTHFADNSLTKFKR